MNPINLTILLVMISSTFAFASDVTVKLKSGAVVQGKVVARTDHYAWLETTHGEIALPISSVDKNSWRLLQNLKLSPRRGKLESAEMPVRAKQYRLIGTGRFVKKEAVEVIKKEETENKPSNQIAENEEISKKVPEKINADTKPEVQSKKQREKEKP